MSLNCTYSGVAAGAAEATEVFPRAPKWAGCWQDGVFSLSVACPDKIYGIAAGCSHILC